MGDVSHHAVDWEKIRADYETSPDLSLRKLALKHGIPDGTVRRRAHEHHWAKFVPVLRRATASVTNAANKAIEETCAAVARRVEARTIETLRDLEPWIEEQRARHVKHIVGLSRAGLARLERLYSENEPTAAKDEQFAAAAMEKHDSIIRRNLGMGDNGTGSTSLNVAVLVGGGRKVLASGPDGPVFETLPTSEMSGPSGPAGPEPDPPADPPPGHDPARPTGSAG